MRRRPRHRVARAGRALAVGLAVAVAAGGCGGDDAASAPPADCTPVRDGAVTLVARDLAWSTDCLQVPAGTRVTFTVRLEDVGVRHDLSVFGPSGKAKTPLEIGPTTQRLVVDLPTPGAHQFVCTIHATMEGRLFVTPRS